MQQSAFNLEEPKNVRRGKSAITWIKINIVLGIIVAIASEYMISIFKIFEDAAKSGQPPALSASTGFFILGYIFLLFVVSITYTVYIVKACRWIYYNIQNLRKFTHTDFSPWGAVFCTMIPWFSGFFDYFIFKDVLERQQEVLSSRGKDFATIPAKMLIGIPVMTLLLIGAYFCDSIVQRMLALVLAVSICVLYIKAMKAMIENEKALSIIHERELLERKVDEILAQRENS